MLKSVLHLSKLIIIIVRITVSKTIRLHRAIVPYQETSLLGPATTSFAGQMHYLPSRKLFIGSSIALKKLYLLF